MASGKRVLCQVCHRFIPLRQDGRVRAHLAAYGKRAKCEGSGMFSARVETENAAERGRDYRTSWDDLSPAERFNAREEWAKADALYFEYHDMRDAHAASLWALDDAYDAMQRAEADAKALAPWHLIEPDQEAS